MTYSEQGASGNFRTVVLGGLYRGPSRERVRSALSQLGPGQVVVVFFADRASPELVFDVVYRRWRVFPLCEFPELFGQIARIMSLDPGSVVACGDCILTLGTGLIASYHFGCHICLHLPDQPSENKQKKPGTDPETPGTDPVVPQLPRDGNRVLADPLSPAWRKVLRGFSEGLPDLQARGEGNNSREEIESRAKRFAEFFAEFHETFRESQCAG
ncbi:hypothetical protein D6833_09755 [Candidatus Parcubacteria bacterium]|nr:MAG: hypothetical protein D6833_09755 [Candidatus Parcubacteria bacterium]